MKKSLIALAVASVLPVTAQAETVLSGSVESVYKKGALDTDAEVKVTITEELANSMKATAEVSLLSSNTNTSTINGAGWTNQGTVTLEGDTFGTAKAGTIDSDGAFQAGDVADIVADTQNESLTMGTKVEGVYYSSSEWYNLSLAVQVNASTQADGTTSADARKSQQASITYQATPELQVGFANASEDADPDTKVTSGVHSKTNVVGAIYTEERWEVAVGQQKNQAAKVSGQYEVIDDLKIKLTLQPKKKGVSESTHTTKVTYETDEAEVNVSIIKDKKVEWDAAYTFGDLTFKADHKKVYSAALDWGNADLTLKHEESDEKKNEVSLGYKVSF
jgi:hypothetical protein